MPGKVEAILADTGFFSEGNVFAVDTYGAIPYVAEKRDAHNKPLMERFKPDDPIPEGDDVTALGLMGLYCRRSASKRSVSRQCAGSAQNLPQGE